MFKKKEKKNQIPAVVEIIEGDMSETMMPEADALQPESEGKPESEEEPETVAEKQKSPVDEIFNDYPATLNAYRDTVLEMPAEIKDFLTLLSGFAKGRGMELQEPDSVLAAMIGFCDKVYRGKLTLDMFEQWRKAVQFEAEMTKAFVKGEVLGRNSRIDEETNEEVKDDGVPHPVGRTTPRQDRGSNIFDLARGAR